jgi:hypothetical protein
MENVTISMESPMVSPTPMCVYCMDRTVQIVVNSVGSGFCSAECEQWCAEDEAEKEQFDRLLAAQYDEERKLEGDRELAEMMQSGSYDDFLSQYDDDPSPYAGTYSEE